MGEEVNLVVKQCLLQSLKDLQPSADKSEREEAAGLAILLLKRSNLHVAASGFVESPAGSLSQALRMHTWDNSERSNNDK
jgi:hypothetical protein